jgi:hypothetical protein
MIECTKLLEILTNLIILLLIIIIIIIKSNENVKLVHNYTYVC